MTALPHRWSHQAEINLSMRRMSGEKGVTSPTFWPGRPSHHHGECPLIADGELLAMALTVAETIAGAQTEFHTALTASHEYTDRELATTQESLRVAIAKIESLRQRISGAGAVLAAIEREAVTV